VLLDWDESKTGMAVPGLMRMRLRVVCWIGV